MSEEKKTETTEVASEEAKKVDANESTSVDEGAKKVDNIDYAKLLKEEQDRADKAEKALAEKRFKSKRTEEPVVPTYEDDEEKPLTANAVMDIIAKERSETEKMFKQAQIEDAVSNMAGTEAEKELILEIHKNRQFPGHLSVSEQVEESYLIANKKRLLGENAELKRAVLGKSTVSRNSASTHHDKQQAGEPDLSAGDRQAITEAGFKWSGSNRRFEKKLPNGKIMYRDPKTKQSVVV